MRIIAIIIVIITIYTMIGEALTVKCTTGLEASVNASQSIEVHRASCTNGYLAVEALVHNQTSCSKTATINISSTLIKVPVNGEPRGDGCEYLVDTRGVSPARLSPGLRYTIILGHGARITVEAHVPEPTGVTAAPQAGNSSAVGESLLPYTNASPHAGAYTRGKEAGHKILKVLLIISLLASTALAAVKEYG